MPNFREFTQSSLQIKASKGNRAWFAKASMQNNERKVSNVLAFSFNYTESFP
jgi:hypothetical protein